MGRRIKSNPQSRIQRQSSSLTVQSPLSPRSNAWKKLVRLKPRQRGIAVWAGLGFWACAAARPAGTAIAAAPAPMTLKNSRLLLELLISASLVQDHDHVGPPGSDPG